MPHIHVKIHQDPQLSFTSFAEEKSQLYHVRLDLLQPEMATLPTMANRAELRRDEHFGCIGPAIDRHPWALRDGGQGNKKVWV